ncbi:hypothetical protein A8926_5900 [Saccharopolyspora spinosa]|uniref:Uncharacterized protein n=1 Tax=Saccharopolyspora spinosa TaxID=60894 RepID=A0A2N3Y4M7_SACSN|nr:hypothetical protein A8926_5900 [Saccharopolyspora spinosa]
MNRSVILRTRKRVGRLMHPDGHCTGEVLPLSGPLTDPRAESRARVRKSRTRARGGQTCSAPRRPFSMTKRARSRTGEPGVST